MPSFESSWTSLFDFSNFEFNLSSLKTNREYLAFKNLCLTSNWFVNCAFSKSCLGCVPKRPCTWSFANFKFALFYSLLFSNCLIQESRTVWFECTTKGKINHVTHFIVLDLQKSCLFVCLTLFKIIHLMRSFVFSFRAKQIASWKSPIANIWNQVFVMRPSNQFDPWARIWSCLMVLLVFCKTICLVETSVYKLLKF